MKRAAIAVILVIVIAVTSTVVFAQGKKADKAKDPVCGLVVEKNPELSVAHKGEVYYFCSKADMEQFKKNPEKYEKKK